MQHGDIANPDHDSTIDRGAQELLKLAPDSESRLWQGKREYRVSARPQRTRVYVGGNDDIFAAVHYDR